MYLPTLTLGMCEIPVAEIRQPDRSDPRRVRT